MSARLEALPRLETPAQPDDPAAARGSLAMLVYAVLLRSGSSCSASPTTPCRCSSGSGSARSPGTSRRRRATTWASCATGGCRCVGLVVYFYSRGLTDELGLPVHYTMPIRVDEWLFGGVLPTEWLQERLVRRPVPEGERPALVRRLLHHRLRLALPDRPDHRGGAVGARARASGCCGCAATSPSTSARWSSTSSTRWRRRGWPPSRATSTPTCPGSPAAAGPTSGWTASTWSSRASATRSPRCRRCTPASRSWSRCTASGGCARRCAGCWCSTRSPCRPRSSTTPSTTSSTSSPASLLAALVMVGCGAVGAPPRPAAQCAPSSTPPTG